MKRCTILLVVLLISSIANAQATSTPTPTSTPTATQTSAVCYDENINAWRESCNIPVRGSRLIGSSETKAKFLPPEKKAGNIDALSMIPDATTCVGPVSKYFNGIPDYGILCSGGATGEIQGSLLMPTDFDGTQPLDFVVSFIHNGSSTGSWKGSLSCSCKGNPSIGDNQLTSNDFYSTNTLSLDIVSFTAPEQRSIRLTNISCPGNCVNNPVKLYVRINYDGGITTLDSENTYLTDILPIFKTTGFGE